MIKTAERSGKLEGIMQKLSRVYGKEVEVSLKTSVKLLNRHLLQYFL